MQATIDFAIEIDPVIANFSMMTPYPGTKVYEMVKRQGRFLINDWEDYVFFDQIARYEMGDMTAELVEEMYRRPIDSSTCALHPSCAGSRPRISGSTCRGMCESPATPSSPRRKRPAYASRWKLKDRFRKS